MIRLVVVAALTVAGCAGNSLPAATGALQQQVVLLDPLDQPLTVAVPEGAVDVALWRNNELTVAVQLLFMRGADGGVLYDYELAAGAVMLEPVPLFAAVADLRVARVAGAETEALLVFDVR